MGKSQTATEYLIILAVVIVIALVVVNTMGGFPGIGSGTSKKVSDMKLASDTIGIESYSIGADSSLFKLKNNYYDTVTVTSFKVNNQTSLTCNSSNTNPALPIVLNVGQSMIITCNVVNTSTYTLSSKQTPMVGVIYTDNMGSSRTAGNEGSAVATSGSQGQVTPPVIPSYTITFDANGGTGLMSTQTINENASANLIANNFTRTNYVFGGWNTLANGSGTNYSDNVSYTMGFANVTLYAKWVAVTYTITFNANGGTGSMLTQTIQQNASANLTPNNFTRTNYTFGGWNTLANGSGSNYSDNVSYTMGSADLTLYANWTVVLACDPTLTDSRDSKVYNTVLIGTQCWMKQNLNVGIPVTGVTTQTNNSIIEKYCYNNDENNCATYGGLYQWNEMMGYSTTPGIQGICPTGWHIPTDTEYKTLVEGQATLGCESATGWQCSPAGSHLSSFTLNHDNTSGFTALLAGVRSSGSDGAFTGLGSGTYLRSSLQSGSSAWVRYLDSGHATVYRYAPDKTYGSSVRCLKD